MKKSLFLIITLISAFTARANAGINITGTDISEEGNGCAYVSHTFYLEGATTDVTTCEWTFKLKDKSGQYAAVSTRTESSFTIDAIDNPDSYFVSLHGEMDGLIECSCTVSGESVALTPLAISLDLKPQIVSISNLRKEFSDDYSFYLHFDLEYLEAQYVTIEIEEEYNPYVSSTPIKEPSVAHIKTPLISGLHNSWVNVLLENKYGETEKMMHFKPEYVDTNITIEDDAADGKLYAYQPHTFSLDEELTNATDFQWTFKLKDKNEKYTLVSSGDGAEFSIEPIIDTGAYYVTPTEELMGLVECTCMVNGNPKVIQPLAILLDLKPQLIAITDVRKEFIDANSFYLLCDVEYGGADCVNVEVEEQFNNTLRDYKFTKPSVAQVKTGAITALYDSQVRISVSSKYGKAEETLYFKPDYQGTGAGTPTIIGSHLSEDGKGSAYQAHTFTLDGDIADDAECSWIYKLKDNEGNFTVVSSGEGSTFTVGTNINADNYFVNTSKELEGLIECNCSVNGKTVTVPPLAISLDLKPQIIAITDMRKDIVDEHYFYALFNVEYLGANDLLVKVTEEYSTLLRYSHFYGSPVVQIKTGRIVLYYDSWIILEVSNKYGQVKKTLYFEGEYPDYGREESLNEEMAIDKVEVYRIDGTIVYKGTGEAFDNMALPKGIYIKKSYNDNTCIGTSKFLIK